MRGLIVWAGWPQPHLFSVASREFLLPPRTPLPTSRCYLCPRKKNPYCTDEETEASRLRRQKRERDSEVSPAEGTQEQWKVLKCGWGLECLLGLPSPGEEPHIGVGGFSSV